MPSGGLRYAARHGRVPAVGAHTLYAALPFRVHHDVTQAGPVGGREICRSNGIEIVKGHVRPDHVHLLLSVPPHLAPNRVMQAIKGKTSHHLLMDRRKLREAFWGRHLWRVATS